MFCFGSKDHILDTYHMKDGVAKNKWSQQTNIDITHLQTTNYEGNYGNDDV